MPPGPEKGAPPTGTRTLPGGLTSKIHLACDALGHPLAFVVTGGNINDRTQFTAVMDAIRVHRIGPGRPRIRPAHVLGDRATAPKASAPGCGGAVSATPSARGPTRYATGSGGSQGGRPLAFDKQLYRTAPRNNALIGCHSSIAPTPSPSGAIRHIRPSGWCRTAVISSGVGGATLPRR